MTCATRSANTLRPAGSTSSSTRRARTKRITSSPFQAMLSARSWKRHSPRELGSSHILWLRAAIERGMAPMDALLAATRNIAQAYRKDDELGTVEPNKRADLLVLDANPLDAPENYGRIAHVVKDGHLVD